MKPTISINGKQIIGDFLYNIPEIFHIFEINTTSLPSEKIAKITNEVINELDFPRNLSISEDEITDILALICQENYLKLITNKDCCIPVTLDELVCWIIDYKEANNTI